MGDSSDKSLQKKATDLYQRLTSYDIFLFIHFYRDLTSRIGLTSKQFQSKDLQVLEVGKYVLKLSDRLKRHYPPDGEYPQELLGNGATDRVIRDLFDLDSDDTLESKVFFNKANKIRTPTI